MSDSAITKVCVRFTLDSQDTSMLIREANDGTYEVSAFFNSTRDSGFPAQEVIRSVGRVYQVDVDGLIHTIRTITEPSWFHHYATTSTRPPLILPEHMERFQSRWSVLIEYKDGVCRRWEGLNAAPPTLESVYDLLVTFGMPPLRLPHQGIGRSFGSTTDRWTLLTHLQQYPTLFAEVQPYKEGEEPNADFELLANELVDDIHRYVVMSQVDLDSPSSMDEWHTDATLGELVEMDVQHAPRAQMLALFEALARSDDSVQVATRILETGLLSNWCDRIEALPREEAEEARERYRKEQELLAETLDEAIRARMAKKQVFTARDVAEDVNATTQRASMRIRTFVRKGELQTVGTETPRKYRAA